jgi:alpha-galactosidase
VKIVLIGAGGAAFALRLITDTFASPLLHDSTLTLMDIDADRLKPATAMARRMAAQVGAETEIESTTDLHRALENADYVAIAIANPGLTGAHFDIPSRYGVYQSVGDTSGPGGVFWFLGNAPLLIDIAKAMEQVCPDALMMNYTNPMNMNMWAINNCSTIRCVGLCHGIQWTTYQIARYIGAPCPKRVRTEFDGSMAFEGPLEDISYWVAGVNHMAWFLEFRWKGEDAYPLLWEAMQRPEVFAQDPARFEIMKHFGFFGGESSGHLSEYVSYFRRTPELIEQYFPQRSRLLSPSERRTRREQRRQRRADDIKRLAYGSDPIVIKRSVEYYIDIISAMETNVPCVFNGTVLNDGLITNLPPGCGVEVPIVADGSGLHPCSVGELPPQLAALCLGSTNTHALAVKGFLEQNRESIYQAIQVDPLTQSKLALPEIRQMVSEMFEAHKELIPW